jgi:hypothetical protein
MGEDEEKEDEVDSAEAEAEREEFKEGAGKIVVGAQII